MSTSKLVHLVGSTPFDTAEEAFTRFCAELPDGRLKRIPDGEPAHRKMFTTWQKDIFPPEILSDRFFPFPDDHPSDDNFELRAEHIKPTGFDDAAIESYAVFCDLRDKGVIPANVRFQVCLPTPINVIQTWVKEKYALRAEQLYEQVLVASLERIQGKIPARDLAIQWDMPLEIAHMEQTYGTKRPSTPFFPKLVPWYAPVREGIIERTTRLGNLVHQGVELGIHLCYGDFGNCHWIEPENTAILVEVINGVASALDRPIDFLHVPVPRDRLDVAYYEPLQRLSDSTKQMDLVLGLVHAEDIEGTKARIVAAQKVLNGREFGVATECGLGRTPVEKLGSIFEICRDVTTP